MKHVLSESDGSGIELQTSRGTHGSFPAFDLLVEGPQAGGEHQKSARFGQGGGIPWTRSKVGFSQRGRDGLKSRFETVAGSLREVKSRFGLRRGGVEPLIFHAWLGGPGCSTTLAA